MFNQMMNLPITQVLQEIGQKAEHLSPHVVGGFVRDTLLGRENSDLDVVVTENDNQNGITLAQQLAQDWRGNIKVHLPFGTATVGRPDGLKIDFVTTRRETYVTAGALPKIQFSNLVDDLCRRDFSINAIAASIRPSQFGQIIDPTDGVTDLKQGRIRTLHAESFTDDPTRIFRIFRYASRYGFQIETQTEKYLRSSLDHINLISGFRLQNEFIHIFKELMISEIMQQLSELGIDEILCSGWKIAPNLDSRWKQIQKNREWARQYLVDHRFNCQILSWMALGLPDQAQKRLSLSLDLQQKLAEQSELAHRLLKEPLRKETKPSVVYQLLKPYSLEALVYHLPQPQIEQYLTEFRHIRPNITGKDLINEGCCAGPKLAQTLWERFAQQLDSKMSNRTQNKAD